MLGLVVLYSSSSNSVLLSTTENKDYLTSSKDTHIFIFHKVLWFGLLTAKNIFRMVI